MGKDEARLHPMRNMLLRFVGSKLHVIDTGCFELKAEDLLLLCTDGLHDEVTELKVVSILAGEVDLDVKLESLVQEALKAGGHDNVTVVGFES
jgi:protein phosphatase